MQRALDVEVGHLRAMAPCSHGRRALLYFDLRRDDLLGGPQPHSRTLQKHVIFGLWGEKDDGSSLQATTYMFSAAVGARGHLLECSKSEARLCALLGSKTQDAFFLEAKWHAWHSVWSFLMPGQRRPEALSSLQRPAIAWFHGGARGGKQTETSECRACRDSRAVWLPILPFCMMMVF